MLSASASFLAVELGLTWKPMIMASDADASSTSDSVMAPDPV